MKGEHFETESRQFLHNCCPKSQKEIIETNIYVRMCDITLQIHWCNIQLCFILYILYTVMLWPINEKGLTQPTEVENSHSPVPKAA